MHDTKLANYPVTAPPPGSWADLLGLRGRGDRYLLGEHSQSVTRCSTGSSKRPIPRTGFPRSPGLREPR